MASLTVGWALPSVSCQWRKCLIGMGMSQSDRGHCSDEVSSFLKCVRLTAEATCDKCTSVFFGVLPHTSIYLFIRVCACVCARTLAHMHSHTITCMRKSEGNCGSWFSLLPRVLGMELKHRVWQQAPLPGAPSPLVLWLFVSVFFFLSYSLEAIRTVLSSASGYLFNFKSCI